jgi:glycosyltransferase involved in cell wall biosynthesis
MALARLLRRVLPTRHVDVRRLVMVGRFDNPGWFRAHTTPLRLAGLDAVWVVADGPLASEPPIRFSCPPAWLRPAGRAASKLVWLIVTALRHRPDAFVGFHLFPGALTALVVARLFRRPACYQMTGGAVEVLDGGVHNENAVMAQLGRASRMVERLALAVVREFDLVIVRGRKTQDFLAGHGITANVDVNTGGVAVGAVLAEHREFDLVFVGRLAPIKQPLQFVEILHRVASTVPSIRAAIVGDGPLLADVRRALAERGLAGLVTLAGQRDDAEAYVARAKLSILTSRTEGLSIALAEAMAAGTVPVVADVGELADLVNHGRNGFLVPPNDIDAFASRIETLLNDRGLRATLSAAAHRSAAETVAFDVVAARWRKAFSRIGARMDPVGGEKEPACAG